MQVEKINTIDVIKVNNVFDKKTTKYNDMFTNCIFPNIFISSKKNWGKTSLIYTIIKHCASLKTTIRIFSTTYDNDLTMRSILKKLDKYGINYELFDSLFDEEGNDIIDTQFKEIQRLLDDEVLEKLSKQKFQWPLFIYVFDDFPGMRNSESLYNLIRRNRHIKSMCIFSSQSWIDINPSCRQNTNYIILYSEIPLKSLKTIYEEKVKGMDFEKFLEMYYLATKIPYSFLYINCDDMNDFRIKFDKKIIWKKNNI